MDLYIDEIEVNGKTYDIRDKEVRKKLDRMNDVDKAIDDFNTQTDRVLAEAKEKVDTFLVESEEDLNEKIDIAKEKIEGAIQDGENNLNAFVAETEGKLNEKVSNGRARVGEAIQEGISNLNAFVNQSEKTTIENINNGKERINDAIQDGTQKLNQAVSNVEGRIDSIIETLPGDYTEMLGKVNEIGERLDGSIEDISDGIKPFKYNWSPVEYDNSGEPIPSNAYVSTGKYDISECTGVTVYAPPTQVLYIYRWRTDGSFANYITLQKGESIVISYDPTIYKEIAFEVPKAQANNVIFEGRKTLATEKDIDDLRKELKPAQELPEYWLNHLEPKIYGISMRTRNTQELDSFIFVTDVHLQDNKMMSHKVIDHLFKHTSISKMFCGGDVPGMYGSETTLVEAADTYWNTYGKTCVENGANHYMVRGNHDWTLRTSPSETNGYTMPNGGVYDLSMRKQENSVIASNNGNYYYVDNARRKIRYIVLDTSEIIKTDDTSVGMNYAYGCKQEQVTWFANLLKDTPVNYHVVVIGHIPVDDSMESAHTRNLQIVSDIMSAYKERSHFVATGTKYRIYYNGDTQEYLTCDVDYSNAKGELVGYICGHEHVDKHEMIGGVYHITCGPDAIYNDDPEVTRTPGTPSESIITVFIVNKKTRTLHAIRVGAGNTFSVNY